MELGLSEFEQMLQHSAREFLQRECTPELVRAMAEDERGYPEDLWRKMADLGWLGLALPEAYGGAGLSFQVLAVLLEEMGRSLLLGPYFPTVVLGGLTILDAGSEAQRRTWLGRLVRGELMLTLAFAERTARWDAGGVAETWAVRDGEEYVLTGRKLFVPDAHGADGLIVAARTHEEPDPRRGMTLFLVPSGAEGLRQLPLPSIGSDHLSELAFEGVRVAPTAVLGHVGEGWPVLERTLARASAGLCCWMVGGAQQVLEMTVRHVTTRVQFGRPVGSFQAVQHHCANMAAAIEASRTLAYQAAWKASSDPLGGSEIPMAKSWVAEAYRRVCTLAHQCHGAVGISSEHDLQLYTRRAASAAVLFGDADLHLERVADAMGL